MAGHSLRKEAMLYSEQMSNALTITSECIAGLPESGQHRSSRDAASLETSGCSSIYQQVVGVDAIAQLLGGELKQGGIPAAAVQRLQHHVPPVRPSGPIPLDVALSERRLFQRVRSWTSTP